MNQNSFREYGLPPIVGEDPQVLILGSFPSKMSLAATCYYANPRNHFWPIMHLLFSLEDDRATEENEEALKQRHIALWDVIASREFQPGAMDKDIRDPLFQDIPAFLQNHSTVHCIGLNGGKAAESFRKATSHILIPGRIVVLRLPSTSPANARYSFDQKLERWKELITFLQM